MKKTAKLVLLLILSSVFVSSPQFQVANAQAPISIGADGTVKGTDKITKDGDVYTLVESIHIVSSNLVSGIVGISIERDNVVLDGGGHTLWATGDYVTGVSTCDRTNVTIKNLEIIQCTTGISLSGSNNFVIQNVIRKNKRGIVAVDGPNEIAENHIKDNDVGIFGYICKALVYNNNFVSNTLHFENDCWDARFDMPICEITFNQAKDVGGNYWDDYTGTDDDGDGIGDTPYHVTDNSYSMHYVDSYPLIEQVSTIPEFSFWTLLFLFFIVGLIVIGFRKELSKIST
ncbi:MAG: hypothetical protein NWF06_08455 [Candidatus Bathyarchaeota archaeon]|nr:hypothetical protein [Candidatus Bathyarchaeum sp.]